MKVLRFSKISYEKQKSITGFMFIVPWLIGVVYFFLIPFLFSFLYSISNVTVQTYGMQYKIVGLNNYISGFTTDSRLMISLVDALLNLAYQVPLIIVYSVFLSLILNSKFKGRILVRAIFFMPVIIASGVIINIIKFENASNSIMTGIGSSALFQGIQFDTLLLSAGVPAEIVWHMMRIINGIFELVWKSGVQTLLFLSSLQTVPKALYESAQIEGATEWEIFWKITMPIISPTIMLCTLYTIIDTSTDYSNQVVRYIRELAQNLNLSYSSAISSIWFVIIMAIIGLLMLLTRKRIYVMDDRG